MSSPATSYPPPVTRPDDEVLVRVEGVSKKFCRSLKKSLWYGVCDIAVELLPFGKRQSNGDKPLGSESGALVGKLVERRMHYEISIDTLSSKNILEYMKTITVNVSDPIYRDFTVYAKQVGNSASELIRRAMEDYHQRFILRKTTLRNRRPASVGGPLQPIGREEDLLREMLDDCRD